METGISLVTVCFLMHYALCKTLSLLCNKTQKAFSPYIDCFSFGDINHQKCRSLLLTGIQKKIEHLCRLELQNGKHS